MYFLTVFALLLAYVSAQVYVIPDAKWTTEIPITAVNVYTMAGSCAQNCATKMFNSWSSYLDAVAPNSECNQFPNCMCTKANTDISRGIISCVSTDNCNAQDKSLAPVIFGRYCGLNMGFATAGTASTSAAPPANPTSSSSTASMSTRVTSGMTASTSTAASAVAATRQSTTQVQPTSTSTNGCATLRSLSIVGYFSFFCATILLSY